MRIKQVVTNLLTNAVKYTERGSVTMNFHEHMTGDMLQLFVCVKDTGVGIKQEDLLRSDAANLNLYTPVVVLTANVMSVQKGSIWRRGSMPFWQNLLCLKS